MVASLNVPTDTAHVSRNMSFEPMRSPGRVFAAIAPMRSAAFSAREAL